MTDYDFSDPKIRAMVDRHEPTQSFHLDGTPLSVPTCGVDGQTWPCTPIKALRKWKEESGSSARDALRELGNIFNQDRTAP